MDPRLRELFARSIAVSLLYIISITGAKGITFTFQNNCPYTVWPGLLSNAGSPLLADGGFELEEGQTIALDAPVGWSGRFWGRTGCSFSSTPLPSAIACESGDCGNGRFQCGGTGAGPPVTLAEITLTGNQPTTKTDFYDVSLVDGYNIPIALGPSVSNSTTSSASDSQQHTSAAAATTNDYVCKMAGCTVDINTICPQELQVLASETDSSDGTGGSLVVGCKSACDAFGSPQYCCTGSYANPNTCTPTSYSQLFKQACPRAYSYAFDDATSIFTCTSSAYSIIFCPSSLSQQNGASNTPENSGAKLHISFCWAGFLGLVTLNSFALLIAL